MPKASAISATTSAARRHNPLAEDYAPTQPLKQRVGRKRKLTQPDDDNVVGSKASKRILKIGQDLVDEDLEEQKKSQPNPAFDFETRLDDVVESDEDREVFNDDDDAWGSDNEEVVEELEVDPNDQDIFNRFHPGNNDPSLDPNNLFDPRPNIDDEQGQGTNLADLILEKIAAHEAATAGQPHPSQPGPDHFPEDEPELPPKVIEVYTQVGQLLSRHRSGPLPKPFKILPSLPASQIPLLISLTNPETWTPHAHFLATRLFISSKPAIAQPFLHNILLPRVRDDIRETRKLHVHLYSALKKALYKPAAFFKGILFPLLADGTCTLREAHIVSSVLARVSVPVLHSAAALLRLCDIAAEQFSTRKEDGGGGATNIFIRCLLEKKYALPYKVVDALVFHFLRFKALDAVVLGGEDAVMAETGQGRAGKAGLVLPVLWHQSLLSFAQRYRNDITEDQREALLDLVASRGHHAIGPEVRRELLEGRGRGVPAYEAGVVDRDGGDDTMMTGNGAGGGELPLGKVGVPLRGDGGVDGGDSTMLLG